jgi:predicted dinucleotide-binding enzyme
MMTGQKNFAGKVVIDVTNPIMTFQKGIPSILAIAHTNSGGELCSAWCETLEQSRPLT